VRCLVFVAVLLAVSAHAEPRLAAVPGKLPKDVLPVHYALRIVPAADLERFEGRAIIDIEVAKPVPAITLNAAELAFASARLRSGGGESIDLDASFDARRETATLAPARGLIAAGAYRLQIDYSGRIGKHPQGFYQLRYKSREEGRLAEKIMLATQMEPVHARKLFPGWDEPVFRATFELSAVVEESLTAVSNMPQVKTTPLAGGRKEVAFARSVPMSTYLVALFIGEMDKLEDSVDGIRLAIYTARGKTGQARFAMQATKEIVRYFNEYFGVRYALPKLDQIAVPGGLGGAMENWGAIAYNESIFLHDPAEASLRQQQRVYGIAAHEIAHQWFGNLVTMAWWDNLWLNEGFATWMATKTAERFHPEWGAAKRSALYKDFAMGEDARRTTHPIQTPVEDDARAMDVFDSITYAKGEAFIRMLEAYVGEDFFRDGIRRYMRSHAFSNTTTADLWRHLAQASGRDIQALAARWTEQPGYPVVKVAQRCERGKAVLTLAQERFTLNDPAAAPLTWNIPVILAAAAARRTVLLGPAPMEVRFESCELVRANAGGAGYFRVQYDDQGLQRIAGALAGLDALERLRLLQDAFALVQAGRLDVARYLAIVDGLGGETDRTVWDHVVGALRFLRQLIDAPEERAAFDRYVAQVLGKPFAGVGWEARPAESGDTPILRAALIEALGRAGDAAVIGEARARFLGRDSRPIEATIRPAVLNVVGRYADEETFESLLALMRSVTNVGQKLEAQSALRQLADPKLAQRWLELLLGTDELPPGEAVSNLSRLGGESGQIELGWRFTVAHLPEIYAKASPRGRVYVLPAAAGPFADAARAEELLTLTKAHLDAGALYEAEKTADWIRLKASIKAREIRPAVDWAKARH
jgi:aminopeptidase N